MNPLLKVILQVGVPSAIAVYLVWILAGSLQGEARLTNELLRTHSSVTQSIKETIDEQKGTQNAIVSLMQQICVNSGRTPGERAACFEARQGK